MPTGFGWTFVKATHYLENFLVPKAQQPTVPKREDLRRTIEPTRTPEKPEPVNPTMSGIGIIKPSLDPSASKRHAKVINSVDLHPLIFANQWQASGPVPQEQSHDPWPSTHNIDGGCRINNEVPLRNQELGRENRSYA